MGMMLLLESLPPEQENAHQGAVVRPALRQRGQRAEGTERASDPTVALPIRMNPLRENI